MTGASIMRPAPPLGGALDENFARVPSVRHGGGVGDVLAEQADVAQFVVAHSGHLVHQPAMLDDARRPRHDGGGERGEGASQSVSRARPIVGKVMVKREVHDGPLVCPSHLGAPY